MAKVYIEVDEEILQLLKDRGYRSAQFDLRNSNAEMQAIVEMIPGKDLDYELNLIPLDSPEIYHYIDGSSSMAKYIVDQDYLNA